MKQVTIPYHEKLTALEESIYTAMWDSVYPIVAQAIASGQITDEQGILSATRVAQQLAYRTTTDCRECGLDV